MCHEIEHVKIRILYSIPPFNLQPRPQLSACTLGAVYILGLGADIRSQAYPAALAPQLCSLSSASLLGLAPSDSPPPFTSGGSLLWLMTSVVTRSHRACVMAIHGHPRCRSSKKRFDLYCRRLHAYTIIYNNIWFFAGHLGCVTTFACPDNALVVRNGTC